MLSISVALVRFYRGKSIRHGPEMHSSRSREMMEPDCFTDKVALTASDSFKFLGVTFDRKYTFERHFRCVSSLIAQKLG